MFKWLFEKPRFCEFQNQYATNRRLIVDQLVSSIQHCHNRSEQVFVLSHFPATFLEIQEALDQALIDFDILDQPLDWRQDLADRRLKSPCLSMVSLFTDPLPDALPERSQPTVSVIVTEVHPLASRDRLLRDQIRKLPYPTQLGYYLSLDQPLIRRLINPMTVTVLKQFGMENYSMISSELLTRNLARGLKQIERSREEWHLADSIEEWLRLNWDEPAARSESDERLFDSRRSPHDQSRQ